MDITVSSDIDSEYLSLIQNILDDPEFKKLGLYTQHLKTTRLMHSINVSYISWMIARKFGLDECAAARAGLLHDFFLYGYGEKDKRDFHSCMAFDHPKTAARNSQERFDISEKERLAILSHMFPHGPLPTSREAWIISCADKLCATMELFQVPIALSKNNRVVVAAV